MMSTHVPSPARQTMHSAMYKMPSPNIRSDETWKDRYRQHCKQHFKRARDKLINKMRHLSVGFVKAINTDLVSMKKKLCFVIKRRISSNRFCFFSLTIKIHRRFRLKKLSKPNGSKCLALYHHLQWTRKWIRIV